MYIKKLITILTILTLIITAVYFSNMNRTVSVHDENLIIANNAFIDKKFDLAAQYYSGYINAKNSNNINVLHKYAMSLLFSSE